MNFGINFNERKKGGKMKILKKVLIVVVSLVVLLVVVLGIYLIMHWQGVAEPFEVGTADMSKRVLIATQESKYKNLMVDTLIAKLKGDNVYIRVIDISELKEISEEEWDAEIILHTIENWKLPVPVKEYLGRIENPDEVILLMTSGHGKWKPEDCKVDILTSASRIVDIPELAKSIEDKVNSLFEE